MERAIPDVHVLRDAGANAVVAEAEKRIRAADVNTFIAVQIRFSCGIYANYGVGYAEIWMKRCRCLTIRQYAVRSTATQHSAPDMMTQQNTYLPPKH